MGEIRDQMAADLALQGFATGTCALYLRYARDFEAFHGRPPTELGTEDVRAWMLHQLRDRGRNAKTVNVMRAAVKFLYATTLQRPEVMASVRMLRVDHPQPDVPGGKQVAALLEAAGSEKYRALFMLLYGAGLRVSEALRLRSEDIDSQRGVIHVRNTKNRHDRIVPLPPTALEALRAWWKIAPPRGPFVFVGRNGDTALTREAVHLAMRKAALAAGIEGRVYPHLLRHAYATHMLEMGTDLRTIQILLGHSSIQSTTRYTHLTEARRATLRSPLEVLGTADGERLG